jgi:peptidoglycan/LPS O-acetylase OafA/YrhL
MVEVEQSTRAEPKGDYYPALDPLRLAAAFAALLLADALDRAFPADRSWANFGIRYALRSLPAAFFAAGLWCLLSGGGKPITSPRGSLLVAGCAMVAFGAAAYPTTWFAYLAAIGLFLIGVSWSGGAWGLLSTFGALAYGIYLSHAMFVEGFQFLAARMHYETGLGLTLLNITASFCLSGVLTWFLLRFRQTRFLVS